MKFAFYDLICHNSYYDIFYNLISHKGLYDKFISRLSFWLFEKGKRTFR